MSRLFIRGDHFTQFDKGSHYSDVDFYNLFAFEYAGKHGNPLFGERIGQRTSKILLVWYHILCYQLIGFILVDLKPTARLQRLSVKNPGYRLFNRLKRFNAKFKVCSQFGDNLYALKMISIQGGNDGLPLF
jgi:hypothetical protein